MVKKFLDDNNIKYEDIDVSKDHRAAQEMISKSGQMGVPQIGIGDKIIVGFNKPALMKELGIK